TDSSCELMTFTPYHVNTYQPIVVYAAGWKVYRRHRLYDACASDPCPQGSVCVQYDQPLFERFREDLDFYMCSRAPWYLNEVSNGRNKCKMQMYYDSDLLPFNMNYFGVSEPYYTAFSKCIQNDCVCVMCLGYEGNANDLDQCIRHMNIFNLAQIKSQSGVTSS
ncbi:hypothetical protein SK128_011632, partial [Halocaridina rubra]